MEGDTDTVRSSSRPRPEQQKEADYVYYELELPLWLLVVLGSWLLLVLSACVWLAMIWYDDRGYHSTFGFASLRDDHANPPVRWMPISAKQLVDKLGFRDAEVFARLDRDGNGLISATEFEPLVHHVRQDSRHPLVLQAASDGRGDCDGACVRLRYRLTPPAPSSFQLFSNESERLLPYSSCLQEPGAGVRELLYNLDNFSASGAVDKVVAIDAVTLATALLPHSRGAALRIGSPYHLIGPEKFDFFLRRQRRLWPGVYFEPSELALANLLRPLHRNVFLLPRHSGRASAAVVRAMSDSHLEILFRLHVELQVANDSSLRSVYVTPGGLEGRVVLPRADPPQPALFHLRLATVAIGNGSRMNCHVEMPHDQLLAGQTHLPELSVTMATEQPSATFNWSEEVPEPVAWQRLRAKLLPHLSASFHDSLHGALSAVRADSSRQLHVILAVGGPDQACHDSARALRELALADPDIELRLKYYYVNAWLNFADLATEEGRRSTLAGLDSEQVARVDQLLANSRQPLTALLLDAQLNRLSEFNSEQLLKAMRPPDGLPDPFEMSEPPKPMLTQQEMPEPQDPEEERQREEEAMEAIKKQMATAYMNFLRQR